MQDSQYLRQIASKLVTRDTPHQGDAPRNVSEKDLDGLVQGLLAGSQGDFDFGGTRRVRVVEFSAPVASSPTTTVRGWQLQASDGQMLYVTKVGRKPKEKAGAVTGTVPDRLAQVPSRATMARLEARAMGVKLSVANLAASAAFYAEVLGLVATRETSKFVSFGAISLIDALYAADLSGGAVRLDRSVSRNRIEIHVSDVEAIHARLVEHHVRVVQPITVMPWGERSLHCLDPDGNVVELVERRAR